ncbi:MAG: hypothetical protein JSS27_06470 [Planctomycetes bacterium]|nr:hypothetical protein [Planctomycetota bacterium]
MSGASPIVPPQPLRVLQIIWLALVIGISTFLGFVVMSATQPPALGEVRPMTFSTLAMGLVAVAVPMSLIVSRILTNAARQQIIAGTWKPSSESQPDQPLTLVDKLMAVRQTTLIIELAMIEGTAFFGCMAYQTERHPVALVAVGMALVVMILKFPSAGRIGWWLDRQAKTLADELKLQQASRQS